MLCLALAASGCASNTPETATAPAARVDTAYQVDPNDPLGRWAHHIREASERFDVPEKWIRAVMLRESGGRAQVNGRTITSQAGAIGLMQVMPGTYELMRWQYNLGADPADPHDNILAGTAYLREMYDLFGAPGFLAAYNCGPACYAGHLAGKQRLPRETKQYLAALTPALRGVGPREPSQSAGASAIEVAVVPANAPKTDSKPAAAPAEQAPVPAPVLVAEAPAPVPQPVPVAVAPAEPVRTVAPAAAPVVVAPPSAPLTQPPAHYVAAADRGARSAPAGVAPARSGKAPARTVETEVAEALLPPQSAAKGDRVVIRFVSQGNGGCGSLAGKDRVCVALAGNGL
ncbi:transglycosylase [Azospirillum thermophilum]|uniref:Transglycosylase n=1 Tax=Azospirillum thermophilum TaxID=2202148 RepID=A0A2S2CU27_9PROT|nr:transglycosylase [Azospirillum thermophilum]